MHPDPARIEVIDDQMAAVLRAMTGAQRLRIASDMFSSARQMLTCHLRHEHPNWNDEQVQKEVAKRLSHGAC